MVEHSFSKLSGSTAVHPTKLGSGHPGVGVGGIDSVGKGVMAVGVGGIDSVGKGVLGLDVGRLVNGVGGMYGLPVGAVAVVGSNGMSNTVVSE